MNKTTLAQFIPIIAIFLVASSSKPFVYYSNCVLGKLVALAIVLFYTMLDKTLGAFVATLVILYYQSDFFENTLNRFVANENLVETVPFKLASIEPMDNMPTENAATEYESATQTAPDLSKTASSMSNAYTSNVSNHTAILLNDFRQEYCESGKLKYKNMEVNAEMIEHVFPEIEFKQDKCNPCSESCTFSIIESRLKNEVAMASKSSKPN